MHNREQVITFEDFPDSAADEDSAEAELLGEESKPKSHSLISLEFYQQFFDVDTRKVCQRLFWSMVPRPGFSYLQHHIRPKPDLYGPLWTCLTLVFSVAISGNLAIYLQLAGAEENTDSFKTDFGKVSCAAFAFISYTLIIPMLLWAFLWWRRREHQPKLTLLEAVCLYGYSLAIYIPVSILLVIDIVWFRWSLVLLASCLSGSVLVSSLWPAVKGDDRKVGAIVSAVVIGFHICVAVLFMVLFFLSKPTVTSTVIHSATEAPLGKEISDVQSIPKHSNNDTLGVKKLESGSLVLQTEENKVGLGKNPDISGTNVGHKSLPKLNQPAAGNPIKIDNRPQPQPEPSKQSQPPASQSGSLKQPQLAAVTPKPSGSKPESAEKSKPLQQPDSLKGSKSSDGQLDTSKESKSSDNRLDPSKESQPLEAKPYAPAPLKAEGLQNQAVEASQQHAAPQQQIDSVGHNPVKIGEESVKPRRIR